MTIAQKHKKQMQFLEITRDKFLRECRLMRFTPLEVTVVICRNFRKITLFCEKQIETHTRARTCAQSATIHQYYTTPLTPVHLALATVKVETQHVFPLLQLNLETSSFINT